MTQQEYNSIVAQFNLKQVLSKPIQFKIFKSSANTIQLNILFFEFIKGTVVVYVIHYMDPGDMNTLYRNALEFKHFDTANDLLTFITLINFQN